MPTSFRELREITTRLEKHYRDVQDFEFTIEDGRLFMLQTRTGKRTAQAAVRIAVDMVNEGLITKEEALLRVEPDLARPAAAPAPRPEAEAPACSRRACAASPGAAVGPGGLRSPTTPPSAGTRSEKVILVRNETTPDDIHGMDAAQGILTATGGMTSHAAVVARGMGKSCVVGCVGRPRGREGRAR